MFCSSCGVENKDRAKFCCVCGAHLLQPEAVEAFLSSESANSSEKSRVTAKDAGKARGKFYHHPQNEKMYKYIHISAKALYMIVFVMYFAHLAHISTQRDVIGVEMMTINKVISVRSFKIILLFFCVVQELLVLFAHIKQNFICAIVLVATMLLHSALFGVSIISLIWIPCAVFFAIQLYKFHKRYQTYCQNGEI